MQRLGCFRLSCTVPWVSCQEAIGELMRCEGLGRSSPPPLRMGWVTVFRQCYTFTDTLILIFNVVLTYTN